MSKKQSKALQFKTYNDMMSYADTLSKTSCGGFSIGKPNNVS
jgi:hypothetical protein